MRVIGSTTYSTVPKFVPNLTCIICSDNQIKEKDFFIGIRQKTNDWVLHCLWWKLGTFRIPIGIVCRRSSGLSIDIGLIQFPKHWKITIKTLKLSHIWKTIKHCGSKFICCIKDWKFSISLVCPTEYEGYPWKTTQNLHLKCFIHFWSTRTYCWLKGPTKSIKRANLGSKHLFICRKRISWPETPPSYNLRRWEQTGTKTRRLPKFSRL